jgi:hypothetical protein
LPDLTVSGSAPIAGVENAATPIAATTSARHLALWIVMVVV